MKSVSIPVKRVKIGKRVRQDMGDLAGLARSMEEVGLLQPIGVTDADELVFGERRLRAARELGWEDIAATRVNLESIVQGEYHENEFRKAFTVSERVEIGAAMEEKAGERRGRPASNEIPQLIGEFPKGVETAESAAEQAGFGNAETYRLAKKVVANGTPELVEAMDQGEVSISDAAAVADLSKEGQRKAVSAVHEGTAKTLRGAAKQSGPQEDRTKSSANGKPIFDDRTITAIIGKMVGAIDNRAKAFGKTAGYRDVNDCLNKFIHAFNRWQLEREKK